MTRGAPAAFLPPLKRMLCGLCDAGASFRRRGRRFNLYSCILVACDPPVQQTPRRDLRSQSRSDHIRDDSVLNGVRLSQESRLLPAGFARILLGILPGSAPWARCHPVEAERARSCPASLPSAQAVRGRTGGAKMTFCQLPTSHPVLRWLLSCHT